MTDYRKILACVCLALQLIVLGLLAYTVVQELAPDGPSLSTSLWEPSASEGSSAQPLSARVLGCGPVGNIIKAAAAFTIISIIITLVGLVLTILSITEVVKVSSNILLLVCIIASFTTLASCACLLAASNQQCDGVGRELNKSRFSTFLTVVMIVGEICGLVLSACGV